MTTEQIEELQPVNRIRAIKMVYDATGKCWGPVRLAKCGSLVNAAHKFGNVTIAMPADSGLLLISVIHTGKADENGFPMFSVSIA